MENLAKLDNYLSGDQAGQIAESDQRPALRSGRGRKAVCQSALGGRILVWTPELNHRLRHLWSLNLHHSVIATVLGLSKSAVASQASRLKLVTRNRVDLVYELPAGGEGGDASVAAVTKELEPAMATPLPAAARRSAEQAQHAARPPLSTEWLPPGMKRATKPNESGYRRCIVTGVWFWSRHAGDRISPEARRSKRLNDARGGL